MCLEGRGDAVDGRDGGGGVGEEEVEVVDWVVLGCGHAKSAAAWQGKGHLAELRLPASSGDDLSR